MAATFTEYGATEVFSTNDPDEGEAFVAARLFAIPMDLAVQLGGTITGEHGIGRLKRPWLAGYLGPDAMALNRRIKDALDPLGILNPGAGV